jgi:hypothetical protein
MRKVCRVNEILNKFSSSRRQVADFEKNWIAKDKIHHVEEAGTNMLLSRAECLR